MATPTGNCEIKNNEVKTGNKPGQIAPELAKYLDNPFVSEIHGNRIFYTNEFYVAMAKRIHDEQMTYEDAYESLGFHVSDLGINRAQQAGKNAMEKFKQGKFIPKPGSYDGSIPLDQMPEMSTEEENAYLKARVIYLEAMNEVQKKIQSILEESSTYSSHSKSR